MEKKKHLYLHSRMVDNRAAQEEEYSFVCFNRQLLYSYKNMQYLFEYARDRSKQLY